jgi:gliding motility-associated-like protein
MFFCTAELRAQSDCETYTGGYFGLASEVIHGISLVADPDQNGYYLGGMKNDSAMIIRFDMNGVVEWVRTIDVVPGQRDNINTMILDSDNMLVIGGTNGNTDVGGGGSVFILKYDPVFNQVLWANQFRPHVDRNYCWCIIELTSGGNYLMSNNPTDDNTPNVDSELIEIDKNTGIPVAGKGNKIHLGGSEDITNMIIYNGSIYGTGRFTDGLPNSKMRASLVKMDLDDRELQWAFLGHIPESQVARLYGVDLIIHDESVFFGILGNPESTNLASTKFYIQKNILDGDPIWLKQYDFPGELDWGYEMIKVDDGIIILSAQKEAPVHFILFKINFDGEVLWSRSFPTGGVINSGSPLIGDSQLIQVGDNFVFTGYTADRVMVFQTGLDGRPLSNCILYTNFSIEVIDVPSPVFYEVFPVESSPSFTVITHSVAIHSSAVRVDPDCVMTDTLEQTIDTTICSGNQFEGYSTTGVYRDTLISSRGCDSVRIIDLFILPPIETFIVDSICGGQQYFGYTMAGIYQDSFVSSQGCDSIRHLDLSVVDLFQTEVMESICPGESFSGYDTPGIYRDTFVSITGCDSVRILYLDIDTLYWSVVVKICEGEQWDGYSDPGTFTDTLISSQGCDSIRTLVLQVSPVESTKLQMGLCEARTRGLTSPGLFEDTLHTVDGCDSLLHIEVFDGAFYIPNVFSPNEDGINDFFEIIQSDQSDVTLDYFAIFDRFGNMAYQTEYWPVIWHGKGKNDVIYNPGVFTYIMRYTCEQETIIQHGTITLLR